MTNKPFIEYYCGHKIMHDEVAMACVINGQDEKLYKILVAKFERSENLANLNLHRRITFNER
jgi:hypothetical protein